MTDTTEREGEEREGERGRGERERERENGIYNVGATPTFRVVRMAIFGKHQLSNRESGSDKYTAIGAVGVSL